MLGALRIAVSAGLIAFLVNKLDLAPLRELAPQFRPSFYLSGMVVMALYVMLQAWILSRLLALRQIAVSLGDMAHFNCISSFFGIFLPGGAGADLVMALRLCRNSSDKAGVLAAILFARVAGLLAMAFLALIVALTMKLPIDGVALVTGLVVGGAALVFMINRLVPEDTLMSFVPPGWRTNRLMQFSLRLLDALRLFGGRSGGIGGPLAGFLFMALARGLMDYLMARAVGVVLPFPMFLVFSTLVSVITLIPVSIAGIGVREVTFVGLFAAAGIPEALGIAVSLLSFSLSLWVSLFGGILYASKGWKHA